jgi:hypothetical protein
MIGEIPYMIVWGFFSAMGWMTASYTVDKITAEKEKKEEQVCTAWKEETLPDGTINRTRTCEIVKTSP